MPAGYVLRTSTRVFGIPNFRFYALVDGMRQFLYSQTQNPLAAQAEAALERLAADDMMHRLRRDLSPLDSRCVHCGKPPHG